IKSVSTNSRTSSLANNTPKVLLPTAGIPIRITLPVAVVITSPKLLSMKFQTDFYYLGIVHLKHQEFNLTKSYPVAHHRLFIAFVDIAADTPISHIFGHIKIIKQPQIGQLGARG